MAAVDIGLHLICWTLVVTRPLSLFFFFVFLSTSGGVVVSCGEHTAEHTMFRTFVRKSYSLRAGVQGVEALDKGVRVSCY